MKMVNDRWLIDSNECIKIPLPMLKNNKDGSSSKHAKKNYGKIRHIEWENY